VVMLVWQCCWWWVGVTSRRPSILRRRESLIAVAFIHSSRDSVAFAVLVVVSALMVIAMTESGWVFVFWVIVSEQRTLIVFMFIFLSSSCTTAPRAEQHLAVKATSGGVGNADRPVSPETFSWFSARGPERVAVYCRLEPAL
jgi:hypothetical protein